MTKEELRERFEKESGFIKLICDGNPNQLICKDGNAHISLDQYNSAYLWWLEEQAIEAHGLLSECRRQLYELNPIKEICHISTMDENAEPGGFWDRLTKYLKK